MSEFGGPEVLQPVELPHPQPGRDEALIRVTRAGVNFADTHTRTNSYVQRATLPLVPGGEVAGVREDTGERVVALVGSGGYAQYAVAPQEQVFAIPDGLDDGVALALIVQGTTAWHLYRTAARVAGIVGCSEDVASSCLRRLRGRMLVEVDGCRPTGWLRTHRGDVVLEHQP